ncbi:MAG: histidine ammonia-lyase [Candidatus Thermoplasmatota archaeon]|nr:histidine ammonia-lyase [Candidatus Thermoplasmatota archaeon]MBS3790836.1 histidine ammonia-lyase [Candidatus Thermoplasmatota archaeon]
MAVYIDGENLSIEDVYEVSRNHEKVELAGVCEEKVERSRKVVEKKLEEDEDVYGINTGFGDLANVKIEREKTEELQKNLIRSHASGVGESLDEDVVRATILLRANTLAKGYSGVRLKVIEHLIEMLNRGVHPVIPCQGSVGASGDLAPLAHMSLVLMGEGEAFYEGERLSGGEALDRAGLDPVELKAKEGLALVNGTQVMTAIGAIALHDGKRLLKAAQIASAMSLEALKGTDAVFDSRIHEIRPHPGQIECAKNLRKITSDSEIIESHKDCEKVQDPYTLRCMPQVYGATKDALGYVEKILEIEMNSANDNPLVFPDGDVISGGNFHGQPIALALDFFASAVAEIGDISERTTDKLMYEEESGLPKFLTEEEGLNSGFMIAQYTAASLVSENKVLSHPASVDSIPTSAGQEDHVSMGSISARQAKEVFENVENVVAIELMSAAQGLEYHDRTPGKGVKEAYENVREYVEPLEKDRSLNRDIKEIKELIKSGEIIERVEKVVGELD